MWVEFGIRNKSLRLLLLRGRRACDEHHRPLYTMGRSPAIFLFRIKQCQLQPPWAAFLDSRRERPPKRRFLNGRCPRTPQQEKGCNTSRAAALNQLGRAISQQLLEVSASPFLSSSSRHAPTGRRAHCATSSTSSPQNPRAAPRVINTLTVGVEKEAGQSGTSD